MEAIARKIEMLEHELESAKDASKIVSLKGLWRGISITDNNLAEAKKSLFRK